MCHYTSFILFQTSKKGGTQQEGEKEEIRSLQEQLAALNEISVGGAVITAILPNFLQQASLSVSLLLVVPSFHSPYSTVLDFHCKDHCINTHIIVSMVLIEYFQKTIHHMYHCLVKCIGI